MYSTTILAWVFVHIGFFIAFPALWLLWKALMPSWTDAAEASVTKHPILSFCAGLPIALVWVGAGVAIAGAGGVGGFIAATGLAAFFLYANAGVAGVATWLGKRLPSPADADRPWKATLRGGLALEFTFMLPLVGWLFILPVSLITGCGAATIGLIKMVMGSVSSESATTTTPAPAASGFVSEQAPTQVLPQEPSHVKVSVDGPVPAAAITA